MGDSRRVYYLDLTDMAHRLLVAEGKAEARPEKRKEKKHRKKRRRRSASLSPLLLLLHASVSFLPLFLWLYTCVPLSPLSLCCALLLSLPELQVGPVSVVGCLSGLHSCRLRRKLAVSIIGGLLSGFLWFLMASLLFVNRLSLCVCAQPQPPTTQQETRQKHKPKAAQWEPLCLSGVLWRRQQKEEPPGDTTAKYERRRQPSAVSPQKRWPLPSR